MKYYTKSLGKDKLSSYFSRKRLPGVLVGSLQFFLFYIL